MLHTGIGLFEHHYLSRIIRSKAKQNVAELLVHLNLLEYRFARIVHFYTRSLQSHRHSDINGRYSMWLFDLFGNVTASLVIAMKLINVGPG